MTSDNEKKQYFGSLGVSNTMLRTAKLIAAVDGTTRNKVLVEAMRQGLDLMSEGLEARIKRYLSGEGEDENEDSEDEQDEEAQ